MSIKRIVWTVSEDGRTLAPDFPQNGGVQGEDCATTLVFRVGDKCPLSDPAYSLYIEFVSVTGEWDRSELLFLEDGEVSLDMEKAWTEKGGTTTVRLVAESAGTQVFSVEGQVYFNSRQSAERGSANYFRSEMQRTLADVRDCERRMKTLLGALSPEEGDPLEGYADHLVEVGSGKSVYVFTGTKEQFEKMAGYLPKNTIAFIEDDTTLEDLWAAIDSKEPKGHGLGSAVKKDASEIDNLRQPGFYCMDNVTIANHTFGKVSVTVSAYEQGEELTIQTVHTLDAECYVLRRSYHDGAWEPWAWENPPMETKSETNENTAYLTTEVYNGRPVYTERFAFNISEVTSASTKKYSLPIKAPDGHIPVVIRTECFTEAQLLPRISNVEALRETCDVSRSGEVAYKRGASVTSTTLNVQAYWYYKEVTG